MTQHLIKGESGLSLDHIAADRRVVWRDIITLWAELNHREVPTGLALYAKIIAYDLVCAEVPTGKLMPAYLQSLKRRDRNGQLVFWDARHIADEYEENDSLRLARDRSLTAGDHGECKKCFGTRMEVVPGKGARRCETPE